VTGVGGDARRVRILVADDDDLIREAVVDLLGSEPEMEVIGVAADAITAIALAARTLPDVALVDVRMPGGGGPEAAIGIRRASGLTKVVAYSVYHDPASIRKMIRAGAVGYVVKGASIDEVLEAIRLAANGAGYLSPTVAVGVVRELADQLAREEDVQLKDQELQDRIERALMPGAILPVYQPIVDLERWRIAGVEALARFQLEPSQAPNFWFDDARKVNRRTELENAAIRVEASAFLDPALGRCYVSLNAEPDTILEQKGLREALVGIQLDRVILEITEEAPVHDYDALARALEPFRQEGVRLAVDDAGSGYASLRHILQLEPDVIKLDISLMRDLDTDRRKMALASALTTFAREMEISVVAEGIETYEVLQVLRDLGVTHGQGYFMRRPCPLAEATAPLPPLDSLGRPA
jgi:EAL domain-containing protein (putative c-di-GMP-specific phosphodiesterase class I)/DNA-binding NarL/FixJ family response regulator